MAINSHSKEKYQTVRVRLDMVREKSIQVAFMKNGKVIDESMCSLPRSTLSHATDRGFGNIMTFPIFRDIEVAVWKLKDIGYL